MCFLFSKFLVLSFMLAFCLFASQFQVRAWVAQCSHWTESCPRGIHYICDADSACSCLCACVLIPDVSMNLINSWLTNVNLIRGSYLVLMESRGWINKDIKNNVTNKKLLLWEKRSCPSTKEEGLREVDFKELLREIEAMLWLDYT